MTTQRAPNGLGPGGRRLWHDVLAEFDLTGAELELLRQACRTVDELDGLESALAESDMTVIGSRGQPVSNALLSEIRDHRAMLTRLVAAMDLPEEPATPASAASTRASDAATRRWNLEKHRRSQHGSA